MSECKGCGASEVEMEEEDAYGWYYCSECLWLISCCEHCNYYYPAEEVDIDDEGFNICVDCQI